MVGGVSNEQLHDLLGAGVADAKPLVGWSPETGAPTGMPMASSTISINAAAIWEWTKTRRASVQNGRDEVAAAKTI